MRENWNIQLDKLHKHWHISREHTDRALVSSLPVLDPVLVWQGSRRPKGALNRLALPPGVVVVPPPPAENRATDVNIASPIIRNGRGRLRAGRAQQELHNTPDRELENLRTNESFQVPRGKLQDSRARSERGTTKRARRGSGLCGTRRNSSFFGLEN